MNENHMNEYVITFFDGSAPVLVTASNTHQAVQFVAEDDRNWIASVIQLNR